MICQCANLFEKAKINPKQSEEAAADFTAAHPIGRIGRAEETASAVLGLCSDEASFLVGQSLTVDGGYTVQ